MCQLGAGRLHSHRRRTVPEPSLQLWEPIRERTGRSTKQTSYASIEEPPKDYGETYEADWILQHHLCAQSPVEETGVGRMTEPPGTTLDRNQLALMSKC